ncbi:hypothetical protein SEK29439_14928 [Salmonella enterica subsp. enterica serovar Kentucky str. 29439]|nr:hypothetical protein SEK29439_14928 [Salmonella enterica subsp. enterica serovar Kentucky str. 29439]
MRRAVYPRWREEHTSLSYSDTIATGLPPLTRGTCAGHYPQALTRRFIPADAGNIRTTARSRTMSAVYPR